MTFATAFFLSLVTAFLTTPLVIRLAKRFGAIDMPGDPRRVHEKPTPRWGGIAIYLAILVAWLVVYPMSQKAATAHLVGPYTTKSLWIMGIGALIVLFGILDDRYQISPFWQALFLIGCGIALAHPDMGNIRIEGITRPFSKPGTPGSFIGFSELNSVLFTAIFVFVIAKTMDTIDGIDGLAAGIAAISAMTMFVLALNKQPLIGVLSISAVGACLGFLRYNYHPAKIFMGTGGAQFLGFYLAAVSVDGVVKTAAAVAFLVPLTLFGVPVLDAFVVVIRRLRSGAPITKPDKRHIHHSLLRWGLTQPQAAWVLYIFAILLCTAAVLAVKLTA
ncbi:MAG TPA: MraY family glycosyltransferase [Fimbriimonadales bacterium]|nr:MraY family glycosyltransferase [Fimbriimonadales bacterium]